MEERIDPKLNSSTSHSFPCSDGSALNGVVERITKVAKFAVRTNLMNPQVGVVRGRRNEENESAASPNNIFRKGIGEFHSTEAQTAALKDQGKDSTVTAETHTLVF